MSFEQNYNKELYHYGVKGMKWGVRRYQKKDGSLTSAGIKKYAKKAYAKDSLNSNTSAAGRVYDRWSGAHKIHADAIYKTSSKKKNEAAAQRYLADKTVSKKKAAKVAAKGAAATVKALSKVGNAYISDQVFFGGIGTKMAKSAINTIGRAAITAYTMKRGGYDIKWYDKQGRRVG